MSAGAGKAPARRGVVPLAEAPSVSVLIVSWNCWPDLDRCLRSLRGSDQGALEIVVLDNGSLDGTPDNVLQHYPEIVLVRGTENIGHTRAINKGFGVARGEYVLLLDADTELEPSAISRMRSFLDRRPDVALVAPRTFNSDGSVQETARNFPSAWNGLFGRQTLLSRLFPDNPVTRRYLARDHLDATEPFQVEQVGGACMMFRRGLVDEVGPWDESYFAYWVDTDWCALLKSKQKTVWCVPSARIVHHENNARGRKKSPRRIWMFHRGAYLFYMKWYCAGPLDPRALIVRALLSLRMVLLICINAMRPGNAR